MYLVRKFNLLSSFYLSVICVHNLSVLIQISRTTRTLGFLVSLVKLFDHHDKRLNSI